jgi:predicted DNA-binding transcriptional regulator AlpA
MALRLEEVCKKFRGKRRTRFLSMDDDDFPSSGFQKG